MDIKKKEISAQGLRFSLLENGEEVGQARLYILSNDFHKQPFGFIEYVFIRESEQGKGYGTAIVKELIKTAKEKGCYKLICTSRFPREHVHRFYDKLGLDKYGYEFRMDF